MKVFHSGKFWMGVWIGAAVIALLWGVATFVWLLDSVKNLNAISVVTMWFAVVAGFQATLGMRKADPKDKF